MKILEDEENALSVLTEVDFIPCRDLNLVCDKCSSKMVSWKDSSKKVGFKFIYSNKRKTKCRGSMDPSCNTFFVIFNNNFFVLKLPIFYNLF